MLHVNFTLKNSNIGGEKVKSTLISIQLHLKFTFDAKVIMNFD